MKATKRLLAVLLVLIMSFSVMGASAFAEIIMLNPSDSSNVNVPEPTVVPESTENSQKSTGENLEKSTGENLEKSTEENLEKSTEENLEKSTEENLDKSTDNKPVVRMVIRYRVTGERGGKSVFGNTIKDVLTQLVSETGEINLNIAGNITEPDPITFPDVSVNISSSEGATITAGKTMTSMFTFINSASISGVTLDGDEVGTAAAGVTTTGALTLTDCVFQDFTTAVNFGGSTLTVKGGTYGPIAVSAGTAELADGTFSSLTLTGASSKLIIQDGSYKAISAANADTLSLRDGKFDSDPTGAGAEESISGGYFKQKPAAGLLAADKEAVSDTSESGYNYKVVAKGTDVVATVDGVNKTQAQLATAISTSASAGQTVVLLKNLTVTGVSYPLSNAGAPVIWDLNGKTLSGANFTVANDVEIKNGTIGNKVIVDGTSGDETHLVLGPSATLSSDVELNKDSVLECEEASATISGTVKVLNSNALAIIEAGTIGDIRSGTSVTPIKSVTGGSFGSNAELESKFVDTTIGYGVTLSGGRYVVSKVTPTIKSKNASGSVVDITEYSFLKGSTSSQNKVFYTNVGVRAIDAYQGGNLFGTLESKTSVTAGSPYDYELSSDAKTITILDTAKMYTQGDVGAGKFTLRFRFMNDQTKDVDMYIAPAITVDPKNYTHVTNDGHDMVFTSSDAFDDVYIMKPGSTDLIAIAVDNRTVSTDKTVLTLKKAYLDTLSSGTYTVVFDYGNGGQFGMAMIINKASTATTIAKPTIVSSTGDTIPYASALLTAGLNFNVTPADNIGAVAVDGVTLTDTVHYTLSTAGVLNLKSSYLMSLLFGDHTVTVTNASGSASMTFRTGPGILPLNGIITHTKGGSNTLTYVTTHPITSIAVAGTTIASTNYALSADGKTITFTAAFLNSLKVGTYSVTATVNTGDGYLRQVSSSMSIISQYAAASTPATGDTSNLGLWIGLMVAALALLAVVVFILKKKPEETPAENVNAPQDK